MLGSVNSANPAVTTNGPKLRGQSRAVVVATGLYRRHRALAVDCLETLEEIAIRYASLYRSHGGGELGYIPALNDSPSHIKALASLLRRHLRGWAIS
jgi:protoheme ferro-lyase